MAAHRALFQNHAAQLAAIFQQITGADIARHKNGAVGHFRAGFHALPGQNAQQPVRQVIQIMQPVAQILVRHGFQPGARGGLLFLDSGFGR